MAASYLICLPNLSFPILSRLARSIIKFSNYLTPDLTSDERQTKLFKIFYKYLHVRYVQGYLISFSNHKAPSRSLSKHHPSLLFESWNPAPRFVMSSCANAENHLSPPRWEGGGGTIGDIGQVSRAEGMQLTERATYAVLVVMS